MCKTISYGEFLEKNIYFFISLFWVTWLSPIEITWNTFPRGFKMSAMLFKF